MLPLAAPNEAKIRYQIFHLHILFSDTTVGKKSHQVFTWKLLKKPGNFFISSVRQQIRLTHNFWTTTWNLPGKRKSIKGNIPYDINELLGEVVNHFDLQNPKIGLFCLLGSTILILIPVKMRIVVQLSTFMVQYKLSQLFILKDVTPSSSISCHTTYTKRGKSNKGPASFGW